MTKEHGAVGERGASKSEKPERRLLIVHRGHGERRARWSFRGSEVEARMVGCHESPSRAKDLIEAHRAGCDVVVLEGIPIDLELGYSRRRHRVGVELVESAKGAFVVDGRGVRQAVERWSVVLARKASPGLFPRRRVLMMPGLNHVGLAQALERTGAVVHYADPEIFFGLPDVPGVGSPRTLPPVGATTLDFLRDATWDRLLPSGEGGVVASALARRVRWADVLVGDIGAIRRFAPSKLQRKAIVVPTAEPGDVVDLRRRGAEALVTLMPEIPGVGRVSAAVLEGLLLATHAIRGEAPTEDEILDALAELTWSPGILPLSEGAADVRRFAFVIHPLDIGFIHRHPQYRWTRFLPAPLVEATAAWMPPRYVSTIRGARSPTTGQKIEGHLIALAATPRQMMQHSPRFTYDRLASAARYAERLGCRIMGLGAFTSVVGDAGATVAHEADIPITSGNSLTVAATLEAAKQGMRRMGHEDLSRGRAMIIGATGSIGSVCARLIARAIRDVVLVSIEPEKLIALKRRIRDEVPGARVVIALRPRDLAGNCDLVVTATSAFGQRILDLASVKPGAVICDVARPPDIGSREAALRPDVAVIESGEVLIPGDIDFGYDIGLPPGTAYACLAETALLAMEGRFESFTLGRDIDPERVKEIYRLFRKHEFRIADLRSFGEVLGEDDFRRRRKLAAELLADPRACDEMRERVRGQLAEIPVAAKGVSASEPARALPWIAAGAVGSALLWRMVRSEGAASRGGR